MKMVEKAYQLSSEQVLRSLGSSKSGLRQDEAAERFRTYGSNTLSEITGKSQFTKFFAQFKDLMIVLLLISSGISFYLGDMRTGGILLFIVLVNTVIGFSQEYKAEKILESLKKLIVAEAKVFRSNSLISVPASELVLGDMVYIESGDQIPADGRIIEENELSTNDFALTGESNPVRKFLHALKGVALIGNQRNMVFMGTTVATGNALIVVTATGMNTELGRIAGLSQSTKESLSPLQRELNTLAVRITIATLLLASILVAVSLGADLGLKDAFLFAIGIASAMIPQGLPAEVNVALTQAAGALAHDKALVKKLSAVESLGATSIICTDKTGTLTKNEMTVERISLPYSTYTVDGTGYQPEGTIHSDGKTPTAHEALQLIEFCQVGYFASNAKINAPDERHQLWYCVGDPTEGALITLAAKSGIDVQTIDSSHPELREFPFDSVRKRMSSVRKIKGQEYIFAKGAPESILDICTHIEAKPGEVRKITAADKKLILAENEVLAKKALRNLAFAYRQNTEKYANLTIETAESNLVYKGMVSIIDPVRDEVAAAMQSARDAHIKVSIITGDYAPTAKAIAVRANLADHPDDIVLVPGDELPMMPDHKILELVQKGGVIFARVSPEDKLRIVSLVHNFGLVIAVTGDGINDAPALKAADIGVAMGITGTDVAKQSAEIVLTDDSFHTLVNAIAQGRVIFMNIRKATLSALTSNFGELIVVLISLVMAALFKIPPAISAVQILAVDLIAELFPIAALGWDTATRNIMKDHPRDPKDHIFNIRSVIDLVIGGILIGGLAYINFYLFSLRGDVQPHNLDVNASFYASATTIAYVTICFCQYITVFVRRSPEPTLKRYLFTNKHLWLATALSIFCVLNIVYNPFIQHVMKSGPLGIIDWLYVLGSVAIYYVFREVMKLKFKLF